MNNQNSLCGFEGLLLQVEASELQPLFILRDRKKVIKWV
jgi:hypothetical protein